MDKLVLAGMHFVARIGVTEQERAWPQPLEVDLEMQYDIKPAADTDQLKDAVDYSAVYELVRGLVKGQTYNLIETMAARIAESILEKFTQIKQVGVTVKKMKPPLPGRVAYSAVTIERVRHE